MDKRKYIKKSKEKQPEPAVITYLRNNCGRAAKEKNNAEGKVTLSISEISNIAGVNKVIVYNLVARNIVGYSKFTQEIEKLAQTVQRLTSKELVNSD